MDEIKNENVAENVEDVAPVENTETVDAETVEAEATTVETADTQSEEDETTEAENDESAENDENAENADDQTQDEADDSQSDAKPKKKVKLPKGLQILVDKIKANENLRQMIVFTLFSFICGGSQFIITLVLPALLKLAPADSILNQKFYGFRLGDLNDVFGFPTTSDFIGFLIGSIVGQVLTFVLNRKKTFNCTNNIVISGIMYVILAVTIIFVQTLLGSAIMTACMGAKPVEKTEFLYQIYNITGQAVGGITALVMSFLGNKFLVMRNWGEKKAKTIEEEK